MMAWLAVKYYNNYRLVAVVRLSIVLKYAFTLSVARKRRVLDYKPDFRPQRMPRRQCWMCRDLCQYSWWIRMRLPRRIISHRRWFHLSGYNKIYQRFLFTLLFLALPIFWASRFSAFFVLWYFCKTLLVRHWRMLNGQWWLFTQLRKPFSRMGMQLSGIDGFRSSCKPRA